MTTAQVVETSVTVNNSSIQDHVHPDDHTQPNYKTKLTFYPFFGTPFHLGNWLALIININHDFNQKV